jgi:hypothetical protein
MSTALREARLELDAPLRRPLPRSEAEALVALLLGRRPVGSHPHPLFRDPEAALLLTGESLDHATRGSRVLQEAPAPRLEASASLPPRPALLKAGLDWLGGLVQAQPGEVLGFIVPPGCHRHDMRLLAWDGRQLRPLGALPEPGSPGGTCSMAAFCRATGLPDPMNPDAAVSDAAMSIAMRRVALAQLQRRALPVSQAALDGPYDGAAQFRLWLTMAAQRQGFTTAPPPRLMQAA